MYKPSSLFNILSVGRVGKNFGSIDSPTTNDEEGTWVKSCASYTNFIWYHGRFTRRFSCSSCGLPEFSFNNGSSAMITFFSKLRRIYNNTVHFCFAAAVEYENNDIGANVEDSGDDIVGEEYFKPGIDV